VHLFGFLKLKHMHLSAFFRKPVVQGLSSADGSRQRPNKFRFWVGTGRKDGMVKTTGNAVLALGVERIDSPVLVGLLRDSARRRRLNTLTMSRLSRPQRSVGDSGICTGAFCLGSVNRGTMRDGRRGSGDEYANGRLGMVGATRGRGRAVEGNNGVNPSCSIGRRL